MKSLRLILAAVMIAGMAACVNGQNYRSVSGNHNVVKKDRTAGTLTGVKVSSGVDVYLKQGEPQSLSVEADENLHEYIITEVRDGILNVYTEASIRNAERMRVYVTMKDINSIKTTSAGDVVGETPVRSENLRLSASSAGNIKLEFYAKEAEVDISSSGDMVLSGECDIFEADLSSAGDLNAYDLKVREANLSVSSAGDADIFVTEKLKANASSAGDINYKGDPKSIDVHTSSAGGIHKR